MRFGHNLAMFKAFKNTEESVEVVLREQFFTLGVDTDRIEHVGNRSEEFLSRRNASCNHFQESLRKSGFVKGGVGRRFIVDDDCQQFASQHTNESAIDIQSFKDRCQGADDLGINNVADSLSVTGLKQSVK